VILDLALQGGGAHGAFTWGVLDRLLEEDWVDFEGVSGANAGAMNAAMLAHGLTTGGWRQAQKTLDHFWTTLPYTAGEIAGRLNEITFNANLNAGLHAIAQLKIALADESQSGELRNAYFRELQSLRLHRIAADEKAFELDPASQRDPRLEVLLSLREQGACAADGWLREHGTCLGETSSLDCCVL
jgi:predicted acylesterase/phospholipase RssA